MKNRILGIGTVTAASLLHLSTASAFPVAPLGETALPIEQVRLVCNGWGRCWHTGPRHYRYGYYVPYYRPYYGYYGLYYRPYYGSGYGYYSPGVTIGFGF